MALEDMTSVDPQSVTSYVAGGLGLAVSGATLLQMISMTVGIALGLVSIVCIILTYRSNARANQAKSEFYRGRGDSSQK
ncbi:MAG: hypothetical protein Tp1111SUR522732_34 [Prokaryotic dsDNA virus sp.]|uniref:hypothetical protein n=1 Tax=Methylophaga sp. UBA2689 TaxID=1946878 RepID=UPI00118A18D1|nr:hypothetical protein [Methylophaga sp. UBA2689]QDP47096.1 MAG: hypothetical protein Tp1111SUR522732_34 [Prokaryotic dsDNA virus sp.]|tara:strand:+ start:1471 stop:1707 length:237 start_codon:yes stop_codon:yes gene_type:complete